MQIAPNNPYPPVSGPYAPQAAARTGAAEQPAENMAADRTEKAAFSIMDVIDVVNPLHHLPVVGNIYRAVTDDTIQPPARIIGGGLFGGLIGALSGLANAVCEKITGKDIGQLVMSWFRDPDPAPAEPALATEQPLGHPSTATGFQSESAPGPAASLVPDEIPLDSPMAGMPAFVPGLADAADDKLMQQALTGYQQAGRMQTDAASPAANDSGTVLDLFI